MQQDLAGRRILITSGPTRAPIDAVRYLSNRSTGRLGAGVALEALSRGAAVTLLAGPGSVRPSPDAPGTATGGNLRVIDIVTVDDLMQTLRSELADSGAVYDAIVHAMAVLDYEPVRTIEGKLPSDSEQWELRLKRTPKVIDNLKSWCPGALLIAFKLLTGAPDVELVATAAALGRRCRADFVVANNLEKIDGDTHPALIIDAAGDILARPCTKAEIARQLCDIVATSAPVA